MLCEIEKTDKLLRSYDSRLFCKWNDDQSRLEIWEHGTKGKDYLVKIIEDRPFDYLDLEQIHERNMAAREQDIIDEVDALNREHKHYHMKDYRKQIRRISVENFNQIFHNPVITGQVTINP